MKTVVVMYLFLGCTVFGFGSSLNCYSCSGSSDKTCEETQTCGPDNSCLKLSALGFTYRQCLKTSLCGFDQLSVQPPFSEIGKFNFKCCTSNLCNSAPSTAATPGIGLLTALLLMWWNIH